MKYRSLLAKTAGIDTAAEEESGREGVPNFFLWENTSCPLHPLLYFGFNRYRGQPVYRVGKVRFSQSVFPPFYFRNIIIPNLFVYVRRARGYFLSVTSKIYVFIYEYFVFGNPIFHYDITFVYNQQICQTNREIHGLYFILQLYDSIA